MIAAGVPLVGAATAGLHGVIPHSHPWDNDAHAAGGHESHASHAAHGAAKDGGHANFRNGAAVDHRANGFDPHELLRDFDWGKTRRLASGRVLREWTLTAHDK